MPCGASEPTIYHQALSRTGNLDASACRLLVSNGMIAMSIDQVKPVRQFVRGARLDMRKAPMQWFAQSRIINREKFTEVPPPRKSKNRSKELVAEQIQR
jgi:hypothetical protein